MLLRAILTLCLLDLMTDGCGCNASYIPNTMRTHIEKLTSHYKVPNAQLFDGNPVFSTETFKHTFKDSEKRVLTSMVLEVYLNLFSQMLNQTDDQVLRSSLVHVQGKVQELQTHYYPGNLAELKKQIKNLWAIKTSDNLVQGKALRELMNIFEKASKLANSKTNNHRGKRQAMRRKAKTMF